MMPPSAPAPIVPSAAQGVYCLANDGALEWFQAFVRSFRKYNPTLPLTVIPYNTSMAQLKTLQTQFQFTIMDEAAAARFDAIAHRVAGQRIAGGTFRKLCCFCGVYDTFLFLDSDIVVTSNLDPLFQIFQTSVYDFIHFGSDISMVYTPEFAKKMVVEYNSQGFNSGAFVSRRACFSESEIMTGVESGEKIRDCFSIWGEQPFLNYLCDTARRRLVHAAVILPELASKSWARSEFDYDIRRDRYVDPDGREMPFIHWPGCEYPTMVRPEIFLRFRTLGLTEAERGCYIREFYYRRAKQNVKELLLKIPLFAKIWAQRQKARTTA